MADSSKMHKDQQKFVGLGMQSKQEQWVFSRGVTSRCIDKRKRSIGNLGVVHTDTCLVSSCICFFFKKRFNTALLTGSEQACGSGVLVLLTKKAMLPWGCLVFFTATCKDHTPAVTGERMQNGNHYLNFRFIGIYMHACVCAGIGRSLWSLGEVFGDTGSGVTGGCDPPSEVLGIELQSSVRAAGSS